MNSAVSREIAHAADVLRSGGLVAMPTETVYGLAADASNARAVARIFSAKGRPADHPLIVHLAAAEQIADWARDIPPQAWALARHFWPGPLTLILRRAPHVLDCVTGTQDTVGLRVPDHPLALELLRAFGGGLAAPSANRFGRLSPTTAANVREELGNAVDCILDGGPCRVGVESTIIDLSGNQPRLLRPGMLGAAAIESALGTALHGASPSIRAPGTLRAHYAPGTPLRLLPTALLAGEAARRQARGERVAAVTYTGVSLPGTTLCRSLPADPAGYAQALYAELRRLDDRRCDCLLVEAPPADAAWQAVRDRLQRAAYATAQLTAAQPAGTDLTNES